MNERENRIEENIQRALETMAVMDQAFPPDVRASVKDEIVDVFQRHNLLPVNALMSLSMVTLDILSIIMLDGYDFQQEENAKEENAKMEMENAQEANTNGEIAEEVENQESNTENKVQHLRLVH